MKFQSTNRRQKRLLMNKNSFTQPTTQALHKIQHRQDFLIERFVTRVNALCPLSHASPTLQARVLEEVKTLALQLDFNSVTGSATGYQRRVLYDASENWSLAAIILRPGQETHAHDHGGWGCAATVQGLERNRWFILDSKGNLVLSGELDYPPGTGYIFMAQDVHQPVGADPQQVTVALHFLVQDSQWQGELREP